MEALIWIGIVVYILTFFLIVRFSPNRAKYLKDPTVTAFLYSRTVWGARLQYYRLVAGMSGIVTLIVIAIVKALI